MFAVWMIHMLKSTSPLAPRQLSVNVTTSGRYLHGSIFWIRTPCLAATDSHLKNSL